VWNPYLAYTASRGDGEELAALAKRARRSLLMAPGSRKRLVVPKVRV
jgi:hypothetical protein